MLFKILFKNCLSPLLQILSKTFPSYAWDFFEVVAKILEKNRLIWISVLFLISTISFHYLENTYHVKNFESPFSDHIVCWKNIFWSLVTFVERLGMKLPCGTCGPIVHVTWSPMRALSWSIFVVILVAPVDICTKRCSWIQPHSSEPLSFSHIHLVSFTCYLLTLLPRVSNVF